MSEAARVNVVARTTEKQFLSKKKKKAGNIFTSERAAKCHAQRAQGRGGAKGDRQRWTRQRERE